MVSGSKSANPMEPVTAQAPALHLLPSSASLYAGCMTHADKEANIKAFAKYQSNTIGFFTLMLAPSVPLAFRSGQGPLHV